MRLPTRPMPALDGMRALAIGAVFLTHWGVRGGGVFGVDLFFVLSGFLITTLLTAEQDRTGSIGLRAFYRRRFARLMPALVVVVVVTAAVFIGGNFESRPTTALAAVTSLLYVSNWFGFALDRFLGVLNITWTLSQEEQFYLVIPWFTRRLAPHRRRRAGLLLVGLAVVLAIARAGQAVATPDQLVRVYENPITNMDGLALGAGLSLLLTSSTQVPRLLRSTAASVGAIVLFLAVFVAVPFTARGVAVGVVLTNVVAVVLIVGFVHNENGLVSKVAANPILVWIGRRSYMMYLVQSSLLFVYRRASVATGQPILLYDVLAFAATLAVAGVTYPVEQRIRRHFGHRRIAADETPQPTAA